ncbi:sodium leak channel NALCN-like isoform X2 [Apostichopus japonicus]|uniref:sodium leak channel NALCN-like isoform X2 n=1 Tax=Stichopus japonicus TaxID=307972 RepID=UPI003AB1FE3B
MGLRKRKQSGSRLPEDIPLADYGADENITDNVKIQWVNQPWVRTALRGAAVISFISVCLNTPKTFEIEIPGLPLDFLKIFTLIVDSVITLLLALEMVAKMHMRGVFRGPNAYWKDHWCTFDGIMVIFHAISILIQALQIANPSMKYTHWAMLRCPRPLIMIRVVRIYLKFQLPKARVKSIFKRSGQQVWSVTIFFTFFMVLYGMLGVQMFGKLSRHCTFSNNTNSSVTRNDTEVQYLAIPDTYCSDNSTCPSDMKCVEMNLPASMAGYNSFNDIIVSIFTVYESASLEGWVFILYKVTDSFSPYYGYFFFITMIFFLSWLVKNVFIAVIIETFAEIRVQFRQMYQAKSANSGFMTSKSQLLQDDGTCTPWKLMPIGEGKRAKVVTPPCFLAILESRAFHVIILLVVVLDAILMSTDNMFFTEEYNTGRWLAYQLFLRVAQIAFTLLFDLEVLFKVSCLGFRGFIKRSLHKFDLFLAIGNTIRVIFYPDLKAGQFCYFQVLRTFRLIKLFPTLEDFARKIFGHIVKLGTLVVFTLGSLILVSVISLQLFCSVEGLRQFETFPHAFMSMFQILTQEAWVEVMTECMLAAGSYSPIVAVFFLCYHLFTNVIVLSLFVAVILDNLELNEDHKNMRQLQASQEKADKRNVPLRLRIFDNFPDKPQMVTLKRVPSEFSLPKIRDSFIRQFVDTGNDMERLLKRSINGDMLQALPSQLSPSSYLTPSSPLKLLRKRVLAVKSHGHDQIEKKTGVHSIVRESAHQRVLSLGFGAVGYRGRMLSEYGSRDRSLTAHDMSYSKFSRRALRSSVRGHKPLEQIKENGDMNNRNVSLNIKVIQERRQQAAQKRTAKEEELRENHPYFDKPLFAVGRESRIRKFCTAVIYARYNTTSTDAAGVVIKQRYQQMHDFLGMVTYLTWCSILVTVASCILMMFETPEIRLMEEDFLKVMEYIFVIFMSIEMILKVLADGLFFTPKALIHDIGGILDVFIYITSLIFLCWLPRSVKPGSLAHYFMVLRCCRPLRIFTLVPHLRKLSIELLGGFWDIFLVSILLMSLTFIFASYGVQTFSGELLKCNDPHIALENCTGTFLQNVSVVKFHFWTDEKLLPQVMVPRVVANPRNFDFDNLWNALLALFEVLSLEGWLEVRDIIIDETHGLNAIYIHVFVFCGCMIGLTLFVGVVISNYFENKGTSLLTIDQRRWQDLKGRLALAQPLHLPPRPDYSKIRSRLYDITQHKYFKRLIAFLVLINFFMLSLRWEPPSENNSSLATGMVYVSMFLTILFVIEVILKCISLSPLGYWHSRRNRYDLVITLAGVIWIGLLLTNRDEALSYIVGVIVTFLRFFSITGKHPTLKMLMMTIVVSVMKSLFIIIGLYLLIVFYAFTGVVLFGKVKYGEMLGRHANFKTALNAQAALFRIVTGEDWNKIMHDCMISPPLCSTRKDGNYWETDCGNATASLFYFGSFYVVIAYVVLNLLVAIIMENFSLFYSNEEDALLSYADIKNFQITWNMVDIHRKGVIPVSRVKFVLRLLRGRLEVDMEKDNLLYKHMCCEIEKMRNGQDVTFHDVLSMLSYRSVDIRKSLQLEELMAREELEYSIEEEVAKDTIRLWLEKCLKRMRAKERAANPRGLMAKLGGDDFEAPSHLMVPDFIEPATSQEEEEDEEEEIAPNPSPEVQPLSQQKSDTSSTSPGHKLLVPTLSEGGGGGGARPDGEDMLPGGRRRSTRSSTSSPSVTPQSSNNSIPPFPQTTKPSGGSSASKEVQDWWKEQLHYDSGSEED